MARRRRQRFATQRPVIIRPRRRRTREAPRSWPAALLIVFVLWWFVSGAKPAATFAHFAELIGLSDLGAARRLFVLALALIAIALLLRIWLRPTPPRSP